MRVPRVALKIDGSEMSFQVLTPWVLLALGGMWWAMGYANKADTTREQFAAFKEEQARAQAQFSENIKIQFAEFRGAIGVLPSQAALLSQLKDSVVDLRQSDKDTAERIGVLQRESIEHRERLNRLEKDLPIRNSR